MDSAQQQIVDSINATSNILVTVSTDPSVDELAAALGLTLVLDKLDKRATAIYSGVTPPAITFLEPDKTFEDTADSLRDFIIALNKDKADHLRYKVDGDVVKIFITPYKTALSQGDLEFSQGDYNIETIIALNVKDQDHLDKALDAHGKILHDAKVLTITAGPDNKSSLGAADWHDDKASSLSEMVVSLVNALKGEAPLLDQQTSTALLTGIVAATDRFSNDKTSSQVMTLAAQLMAAGANQQLIAAKLQESHEIGDSAAPLAKKEPESATGDDTKLVIDRKEKPAQEDIVEKTPAADLADDDSKQVELEKQLAELTPPTGTMADIEEELKNAIKTSTEPAATVSTDQDVTIPADEPEPVVTDTTPLTAPTDATMPGFEPTESPVAPVEDSVAPEVSPLIQNHDGNPAVVTAPEGTPTLNGQTLDQQEEQPTVDPFATSGVETAEQGATIEPATPGVGTPEGAAMLATPMTPPTPQLQVPDPMTVFASAPPAPAPEIPELPPLPPLPGDTNLPPLPPPPPLPPMFSEPVSGVMPAGAVSGDIFGDAVAPAPAPVAEPPAASVPGQFKIPGQP
jgi:hypothetical protein